MSTATVATSTATIWTVATTRFLRTQLELALTCSPTRFLLLRLQLSLICCLETKGSDTQGGQFPRQGEPVPRCTGADTGAEGWRIRRYIRTLGAARRCKARQAGP